MIKLWLASLGALVLLSISGGVALAQGTEIEVPFCGALSESECAELDATSQIMEELNSGRSVNTIKLSGTGAALGNQELSLILASDRTFHIDQADLERLNELRLMPPDEFAADPIAITDAMILPYSTDVTQTVSFAFSPELMAHFAGTFNLNLPSTISFHTAIVNEVIYIRLADFDIFGQQPDWVPEWVGIETRVLISNSVNSAIANGSFDAAQLQASLTAPGAALAGSIVYHVPEDQLWMYEDFMTLNSLGAISQDEELVRRYALSWNLARYVGGPLFAQHTGQATFPSPQSYFYGSLGAMLFDGLNAGMIQSVGVSNSYVYSVNTNVTWALGIPGGPPIAERPTLGFSNTMENSELNQITKIDAPTGALVPPINFVIAIANLLQN